MESTAQGKEWADPAKIKNQGNERWYDSPKADKVNNQTALGEFLMSQRKHSAGRYYEASYDQWLKRDGPKAKKTRSSPNWSKSIKFSSGDELHSIIDQYVHFYNYERFQERFGVRAPMEVRTAALNAKIQEQFPIAENKRV